MVGIRKEQGIQIYYQNSINISIKKLFIFLKNFFRHPPPKILKAPTKIFLEKSLISKL